MKLSDFRKEGAFEDAQGLWYEDATTLVQCGILKFCGCGQPEENLAYILGGLELITEDRPDSGTNPQAWDEWWRAHQARELAHFGSEAAARFFYYWADKEGLTEHGGSIPGWLDTKGQQLLELLREWMADESVDDELRAAAVEPSSLPDDRRLTLVHALMASKGWMRSYAEAFVDDFAAAHPKSPDGEVRERS